jgi:hypothetical protein
MIPNVDFETGASGIEVVLATVRTGAVIEIRIGSPSGPTIGTLNVTNTGGWSTWETQFTALTTTSGVHNLYFYGISAGNAGKNIAKMNRFTLIQ